MNSLYFLPHFSDPILAKEDAEKKTEQPQEVVTETTKPSTEPQSAEEVVEEKNDQGEVLEAPAPGENPVETDTEKEAEHEDVFAQEKGRVSPMVILEVHHFETKEIVI